MYTLAAVLSSLILVVMGGEIPFETNSPDDGTSEQHAHNRLWNNDPNSIQLQSGYESYLYPVSDGFAPFSSHGLLGLTPMEILASSIGPLTNLLLKYVFKIGFYAVGLGSLFAFGSILTMIVCSFTSLCTISFNPLYKKNITGLFLNKNHSIRDYVNDESVQRAARLLFSSLEKYNKINMKKKKQYSAKNEIKSVIKQE